MTAAAIPATLVTGFLGAGKTTLLNHLGASGGLTDALVVINEFGQVGLDHLLMIEAKEEMVVELSDGCVCCTLQGDLTRALLEAVEQRVQSGRPPFERVVIETSGVSDPAAIAKALTLDPLLSPHFHLEAVVTLVDAAQGAENLKRFSEASAQVALADLILVTKCDGAASSAVEGLVEDLQARNPFAKIEAIEGGRIDSQTIFDPRLKLRRPLLELSDVDVSPLPQPSAMLGLGNLAAATGARPPHGNRYQVMGFESCAPLSRMALRCWLATVLTMFGQQVLRYKAILDIEAEDKPLVLHGVQGVISPETWLEDWPPEGRVSRMVLITQSLPPPVIQAGLDAFFPEAFVPAQPNAWRAA